MVEPHPMYDGIFVVKNVVDAICTKNMVTGESVYGEKRVAIEVPGKIEGVKDKIEVSDSSFNTRESMTNIGFRSTDSGHRSVANCAPL